MPIPDEIHLNGRTYTIEDCSGPAAEENFMGEMKYFTATILLNFDLDLEAQLRTLIHEAWHVFAKDYGLKSNPDESEREHLAELVSLFMHLLLCHNPEIADCYSTTEESEEIINEPTVEIDADSD